MPPEWVRQVAPLRRFVFRALRASARALHIAARACERLAAGSLRAVDLRAARDAEWAEFNTANEEVDAGLYEWERAFYDRCIRDGDRVLVVGCGTGRDVVALAGRGVAVTGLEPVETLVAQARAHVARHGVRAAIVHGSIEEVEMADPFDVYVFSYFCYSYMRSREARQRALRRIRERIPQTGRVLISTQGSWPTSEGGIRLLRAANRLTRTDWRAERGDVFKLGGRDLRRLEYHHVFEAGELEREAAAAGFRLAPIDHENADLFELRPI